MQDIEEHKSDSYGPRTYMNAGFSDVTLAFATNFNTAGEILTEKAAKGRIIQVLLKKDLDTTEVARHIFKDMRNSKYKTVNIAGNGIYTLKIDSITQVQINQWVYEILKLVHKHLGITRLRSGGQTGADLAGAVAAKKLGIPSVITFPKGYRQRLEDGSDIIQSKEAVIDTIDRYVELLTEE